MGTDKLRLMNGALAILRTRKLANLTENQPSRHALDLVYDDVLAYMIEQGLWNYAQRSVALEPDPDVTTAFGFNHAFEHPSDMVRITKISPHERFFPTLEGYLDEGRYFYADVSVIFLMYVSNGLDYGLDLSRWPATFARAVEFELALRAAPSITTASAADMEKLEKNAAKALRDARSKDAMRQPAEPLQPGRLAQARHYGRTSGRGLWDR